MMTPVLQSSMTRVSVEVGDGPVTKANICETIQTKLVKCTKFLLDQTCKKSPELLARFNTRSKDVKMEQVA